MARVERLLLVVAVVSLGWYATARANAMLFQAAQHRELEELRLERRDIYLPSSYARHRPRVERALVGRIEIPRLGVSAIIREGVDNRTLDRAVGHIPQTAFPGDPGNIALAAHRDTFFRPLKHIRAGDRIRVSTPDGDFSYIVSGTSVVAPTDLSVLNPTPEPSLTLITCYPFNFVGPAPKRFVVRALAVQPKLESSAVGPYTDGTFDPSRRR